MFTPPGNWSRIDCTEPYWSPSRSVSIATAKGVPVGHVRECGVERPAGLVVAPAGGDEAHQADRKQ